MFCKGCGKSVDTSAATCPHCGRTVDALSGGTGFWDLLEQVPERQMPKERREQEAYVPIEETQPGHDGYILVKQPTMHEEIPWMTHGPSVARERPKPTQRQIGPLKISPLAIGIGVPACVLVIALALILSQCSHAVDEENAPEANQLALSAASEWSSTNDEEGGKEGKNQSQGYSADDYGSAIEADGGSREQSNPIQGHEDVSDDDGRLTKRTESAQNTQDQSNEQQQEEGTRNGQ